MYGNSGANRAKWAMINSAGSERGHWAKVHAILQNRESNSSSFSAPRTSANNPLLNPSTVYTYRKKYMEGENNFCKHCGKDLNTHTAVKKLCPKK